MDNNIEPFVSMHCEGETCSVCGEPATNKLSEVIFNDDPYAYRHPLTAYVCKEHFLMIVSPTSNENK